MNDDQQFSLIQYADNIFIVLLETAPYEKAN